MKYQFILLTIFFGMLCNAPVVLAGEVVPVGTIPSVDCRFSLRVTFDGLPTTRTEERYTVSMVRPEKDLNKLVLSAQVPRGNALVLPPEMFGLTLAQYLFEINQSHVTDYMFEFHADNSVPGSEQQFALLITSGVNPSNGAFVGSALGINPGHMQLLAECPQKDKRARRGRRR